MKTLKAVLITIFVMSLLNVLAFKSLDIPQGCYTMSCILSAVMWVFYSVYDGDHIKFYNRIKGWLK